jgi:hypothetical protein
MNRDDRRQGKSDKDADLRALQRASRPAPGKVTRTSEHAPSRGATVQRKAPTAEPGAAPKARSASELTGDRWMDAAFRGATALAGKERGAGFIQAKRVQEKSSAPLPGHGGGAAMPEAVRGKMEAAFGTDFSSVRIHEGPNAGAVGALAYTQGTDIHFAPGQYQPGSQHGQELLGHELAHVVQQRAGVVSVPQGKGADGPAINGDPALEAEADRLGIQAARGQAVSVSGAGHGVQPKMAPGAVIQRGNSHPGSSSGNKKPEKEKEKEQEPEGPSESERRSAIASAYDRLLPLAMELIRQEEKALRRWSDADLKKEWNWMEPAMELAVKDGEASYVISQLVLMDICESAAAARQAVMDECKRRFGKGGGGAPPIAPMSRLLPDVQAPTEEDMLAAQSFSVVEGRNEQKIAMRVKQLELRGFASGKLDELHTVALQHQAAPPPPGGVNLQQIIQSTLGRYKGATEEGHEIWMRVQDNVTTLCTHAHAAGYPVWVAAVQEAIVAAALAYSEFSSTGSWAADREDNGATTRR